MIKKILPISLVLLFSSAAYADNQCKSINQIQGKSHFSDCANKNVKNIKGIITGFRLRRNKRIGFYMQSQKPDNDIRTSEGIFVYRPKNIDKLSIGNLISVDGKIEEYIHKRRKKDVGNLPVTQIVKPKYKILSKYNSLPKATIIGEGGRLQPNMVFENDANGKVSKETLFDPNNDGLDYYESLEHMLVQVNNPISVSPTIKDRKGKKVALTVLADSGSNAGLTTKRGGIVIRDDDFNPERITISTYINPNLPEVNVGQSFNQSIKGIIDYNFLGDYTFNHIDDFKPFKKSILKPEITSVNNSKNYLTVSTFNVENLSPRDDINKFTNLAKAIVNNLSSPDIIALEEVQDNNGKKDNGVVKADKTLNLLIKEINKLSGIKYKYQQIDPENKKDGGQPGGNIRVAFLYNPQRVQFNQIAGGTAKVKAEVSLVNNKVALKHNPSRIFPNNPNFNRSRKSLIAEFLFNNNKVFVVVNHFRSKGGDTSLFAKHQPQLLKSEGQRNKQAQIIGDFVQGITKLDKNANVIVLGDFNDFQFSKPLKTLKNSGLFNLIESLPESERYSYCWQGNAQALDHILISDNLYQNANPHYDIVHINSEFSDQLSDHDPQVANFYLP